MGCGGSKQTAVASTDFPTASTKHNASFLSVLENDPGDGMRVFTKEEVRKHKKHNDCYIIVDNKVYDVTPFFYDHPGGIRTLQRAAGKYM